MIERYFWHILREKGFPNVDQVIWSLGYCQGDGCSFTGTCNHSDVLAMVERIFPKVGISAPHRVQNLMSRRRLYDFLDVATYSIKIIQSDNRYAHHNTMDAEHSVESEEDPWDLYEEIAHASEIVLEYAKSVARELESIGYSLLESFNREEDVVWQFMTKEYLFRVSEIEEIPEISFLSDWDEECFLSTCQSLINGTSRMTAIKAEVFYNPENLDYLDKEEPLASKIIGGLEILPDDKSYAGYRFELVRELIVEIAPKRSRDIAKFAKAA